MDQVIRKLNITWQTMVAKMTDPERLLLELTITHGGTKPAFERWAEVHRQLQAGEITPADRLKALFTVQPTEE